jgi:YfiH family protein
MVTDRPGLVLGILTADCAPVLFADHQAGVIGGAHAGWRGAIGGILGNTVAAMVDLGARADRIVAAIGPTIGPASYEVGAEFVRRFCGADANHQRFFTPSARAGHALFDLPAFCAAQLTAVGVWTVAVAAVCTDVDMDTYANPARWFSHRYNTHHGIGDYGRLVSCIGHPSNGVPTT